MNDSSSTCILDFKCFSCIVQQNVFPQVQNVFFYTSAKSYVLPINSCTCTTEALLECVRALQKKKKKKDLIPTFLKRGEKC